MQYDKREDISHPSLKYGYLDLKLRSISLIARSGQYDIDAHGYRPPNVNDIAKLEIVF
ncbi:hypothetical protein [Thermoplasma sp.]|uniref:hypothetical protein n=1 Tax=Thermoplasma sp. TaxID=1973142 RepID=UPI0026232FC0|nr:hypothetical protein [Thermoplasma sp.]